MQNKTTLMYATVLEEDKKLMNDVKVINIQSGKLND